MLRSEFRFPITSRFERLLAVLLGEAFMGLLAIIAAALTLFPMLFPVSDATSAGVDALQWSIIAWFGFEYLFALASARAKRAFLLSPWRLIDLATILLPLAALLPSVSRALLSSPILRLVRLVRLVTLGVRATGIAVRQRTNRETAPVDDGPAQIALIADAPHVAPRKVEWAELVRWLQAPGREWYHAANPSLPELAEMGAAAGLPAGFLETHLTGTGYPHLATARNYTAIFFWSPEIDAQGHVARHGVLAVASPESLLSLSRGAARLIERIDIPTVETQAEKEPFALRMIGVMLGSVMRRNESLIATFEQELRALENVPVRESSPAFFERAFHLKKELSGTQADLWRLKGVLADLAEGRTGLGSAGEASTAALRRIAASADYLYETVVNTREEVLSVIELHLNIVSFDMNRVMRVLAVVSVLGLIPAVVGGLFGMNLADNPWPFTLPQVAFGVSLGMVVCLYFFFVKGWLR